MLTLKEIAAELGVSHTLVSRVVRGKMGNTRVSDATREAILKRAKELDFQPNRLALALKSGKQGVIGVFIHYIGTRGSELNETFVEAVAAALSELDLRLWLRFFESDAEFLAACNQRLRRNVDGLIVGGISHPELIANLRKFDGEGLPVVGAFHDRTEIAGFTNFQVDHQRQAYLATSHLLARGCRRIAHFQCLENRRLGYRQALEEHGLPFEEELTITAGKFNYEFGRQSMRKLLESGTPFDGLVTESDAHAAGALNYWIRDRGSLENRPLITGIDNSPIAENCVIPLTTVTAEMETTARRAVQALARKMEGESAESELLPPSLVERESTRRAG